MLKKYDIISKICFENSIKWISNILSIDPSYEIKLCMNFGNTYTVMCIYSITTDQLIDIVNTKYIQVYFPCTTQVYSQTFDELILNV